MARCSSGLGRKFVRDDRLYMSLIRALYDPLDCKNSYLYVSSKIFNQIED